MRNIVSLLGSGKAARFHISCLDEWKTANQCWNSPLTESSQGWKLLDFNWTSLPCYDCHVCSTFCRASTPQCRAQVFLQISLCFLLNFAEQFCSGLTKLPRATPNQGEVTFCCLLLPAYPNPANITTARIVQTKIFKHQLQHNFCSWENFCSAESVAFSSQKLWGFRFQGLQLVRLSFSISMPIR